MMVVPGGDAVAGCIEDASRVEGVWDCNGERGSFVGGCWGREADRGEKFACSFNNVLMVPKVLGKLLSGPSDGLPIGGAGIIPKSETRVHYEGIVGDSAVHSQNVRVVRMNAHWTSSSPVWRSRVGYEIARFQCHLQKL